jgi:hypothetical protein
MHVQWTLTLRRTGCLKTNACWLFDLASPPVSPYLITHLKNPVLILRLYYARVGVVSVLFDIGILGLIVPRHAEGPLTCAGDGFRLY